jgi:hypothetical protein
MAALLLSIHAIKLSDCSTDMLWRLIVGVAAAAAALQLLLTRAHAVNRCCRGTRCRIEAITSVGGPKSTSIVELEKQGLSGPERLKELKQQVEDLLLLLIVLSRLTTCSCLGSSKANI